MNQDPYDVVVIGSGPGGYVCAIRCAQLGLSTAIVEKDDTLGGTCLNIGCIPSKALLHSSELFHQIHDNGTAHGILADNVRPDVASLMKRKDGVVEKLLTGVRTLLQKRKVEIIHGTGRFAAKDKLIVTKKDGEEVTLAGKNFVIATGSVPVELPFLKPDGEQVVTSTEALCFAEVPESLLVVGAGAIGLELGSVWSRLGSEVTFVEFLPTIAAGSDKDVSQLAERIFKKQGMTLHTSTKVTGCRKNRKSVTLTAERKDKEVKYKAEKVLLSVGRQPFTAGLNLAEAGVQTDEKGRIPTSDLRTEVEGIWAIGDVTTGPMLAHKAEEDGVAVAEAIAGSRQKVDYGRVANVIYTDPEIATVGLSEEEAEGHGIAVKVGKFPLQANGRALAQDTTDGMAKIIADAQNDRILGAAIIATGASEMIASVIAHMEYGGSAEDLGRTIHAHPTMSESVKEAALAVHEEAIHSL